MTETGTVELFHSRDDRGTRSIWVVTLENGGLRIEGQDLGSGVSVFGKGLTEYEWTWTIASRDVPRIPALLGADPGHDLLAALRGWIAASNGSDPGQHLKDAGVDMAFWSRIGE